MLWTASKGVGTLHSDVDGSQYFLAVRAVRSSDLMKKGESVDDVMRRPGQRFAWKARPSASAEGLPVITDIWLMAQVTHARKGAVSPEGGREGRPEGGRRRPEGGREERPERGRDRRREDEKEMLDRQVYWNARNRDEGGPEVWAPRVKQGTKKDEYTTPEERVPRLQFDRLDRGGKARSGRERDRDTERGPERGREKEDKKRRNARNDPENAPKTGERLHEFLDSVGLGSLAVPLVQEGWTVQALAALEREEMEKELKDMGWGRGHVARLRIALADFV